MIAFTFAAKGSEEFIIEDAKSIDEVFEMAYARGVDFFWIRFNHNPWAWEHATEYRLFDGKYRMVIR